MNHATLWERGITFKLATDADIAKAEAHANTEDGAGSLFIGDELVAVFDEYGTAKLVAGTDATPTKGECESLFEVMVEWIDGLDYSTTGMLE